MCTKPHPRTPATNLEERGFIAKLSVDPLPRMFLLVVVNVLMMECILCVETEMVHRKCRSKRLSKATQSHGLILG